MEMEMCPREYYFEAFHSLSRCFYCFIVDIIHSLWRYRFAAIIVVVIVIAVRFIIRNVKGVVHSQGMNAFLIYQSTPCTHINVFRDTSSQKHWWRNRDERARARERERRTKKLFKVVFIMIFNLITAHYNIYKINRIWRACGDNVYVATFIGSNKISFN